ncbi:MAG: hypothetical protein AAGB26_08345 [Planctomycetota bacterium]
MRVMLKVILVPALLLAACVAAGLYGVVHDQVTYTVSPDYYHHFKFEQFRIPEQQWDRTGAAAVGWAATYWMGLVVGLPLLVIGFLLLKLDRYVKAVGIAFGLAMMTAACIGLLALVIVLPLQLETLLTGYRLPEGVADREGFLEVGMIHNASYLGGGLGFFVALGYLFKQRWGKPVETEKTTPQPDAVV